MATAYLTRLRAAVAGLLLCAAFAASFYVGHRYGYRTGWQAYDALVGKVLDDQERRIAVLEGGAK